MLTHNFKQGSPEWHAHRASHFNASDAPAMLGCSPYMTRTQLLHRLHTGLAAEVDQATQRRFDDGHRFEALARPIAEKILGEDLYPVTGSEGELSASFDGLPLMEEVPFEHKTLNEELRACFDDMETIAPEHRETSSGKSLPKNYRVQMEQQLMVCGGQRVLFMASKWNGDTLVEERHCWYYPDPALRAEILAGWKQFAADLATYTPQPAAAVVVAAPVQSLPAVTVIVSGEIAVKDNFAAFEVALRDFLEHRLIRAPKTDQDFADLGVQIKAMKGAEAALESAEVQMLAQIQAVDSAKKTKHMLLTLVAENRRMAEKLLASEKERRRGEIVSGGITAFREHIASLNNRLGKPYMPPVPADFALAIKGMSSVSSMENAVDSLLARAKIAANEVADRLDLNLRYLRENAAQHAFLFADTAQIIQKAPDDLQALVKNRITEHQAAEQKKEEAQRERIRAEERDRIEREQRQAQEAEDALIASFRANALRIEADTVPYIQKAIGMFESGAKDFENDPRPRVILAIAEARAQMNAKLEAAIARAAAAPAPTPAPTAAPVSQVGIGDDEHAQRAIAATHTHSAPVAAPGPAVIQLRPPAAESTATIRLGQINERLTPIQLTAEGLATLGFTPVATDKSAKLYREADLPRICAALIERLTAVSQPLAA